jgi:hypothetical protein
MTPVELDQRVWLLKKIAELPDYVDKEFATEYLQETFGYATRDKESANRT